MIKKQQKAGKNTASAAGIPDSELPDNVKGSAQQIWLAGLGAFSKAQEEGGKLFETLMKEGVNLQRRTQAQAEEKIGKMTGRMSAMAGEVTAKAGQHWDKLESIFESRVSKAMARLGVPSASEVHALSQRMDALAAEVARLGKPPAAKKTKAPAKKTAMHVSVPRKASKRGGTRKAST